MELLLLVAKKTSCFVCKSIVNLALSRSTTLEVALYHERSKCNISISQYRGCPTFDVLSVIVKVRRFIYSSDTFLIFEINDRDKCFCYFLVFLYLTYNRKVLYFLRVFCQPEFLHSKFLLLLFKKKYIA